MARIFLMDGSAYIHRAFHAIRDLKTSQGVPTNAVYGFTTMLNSLVRESEPDYLAVILDTEVPRFRHRTWTYEHYKANRPEMPDSRSSVCKRIKAMRFSLINLPGRVLKRSRRFRVRLSWGHPSLEAIGGGQTGDHGAFGGPFRVRSRREFKIQRRPRQ